MKVAWVLTATVIPLAGALWALRESTRAPAPDSDPSEVVAELLGEFSRTSQKAGTFDGDSMFDSAERRGLLDPAEALPQSFRYKAQSLRSLYSYSRTCKKPAGQGPRGAALAKAWQWHRFVCGEGPLPDGFLRQPPFMHPFGHSFAWLLLQHKTNQGNTIPVNLEQLPYFHAAELPTVTTQLVKSSASVPLAFRFLADLRPTDLEALLHGAPLLLGPSMLAVLRPADRGDSQHSFDIFSTEQLAIFLSAKKMSVRPTAAGMHCWYLDRGVCWVRDHSQEDLLPRIAASGFVLSTGILLSFIGLTWRSRVLERRKVNEERSFLLRTMTHELRTPITSLRVSLENFRNGFDLLTPSQQSEFLRMCDEAQRLTRVIEASEHYVRMNEGERPSTLKKLHIPSARDLCLGVLESEGLGESCLEAGPDFELTTDPFWLSVGLRNLLANAKLHGSPPIVLSLKTPKEELEFAVADGGSLRTNHLPELLNSPPESNHAKGLGFGLKLVDSIARNLGGRLELKTQPTTFSLVLPG